jgi:hypothetical protein
MVEKGRFFGPFGAQNDETGIVLSCVLLSDRLLGYI